MFGYIRPFREELTLRQDAEYRAHYCGLCRALGLRRGLVARALLQYDMVFVALLADAVAPCGDETIKGMCALRGRVPKRAGPSTDYAADVSLLLLYGKLLDDKADRERFAAPALVAATPFVRGAIKRRAGVYAAMNVMLREQAELEHACCDSPDAAAEPAAQFLSSLFGALPVTDGVDVDALRWLGYNLGKWIYLIDAADDVEKDKKRGNYNVFLAAGLERAPYLLTHCAAQAQAALDLLGVPRNEPLLNNIISLGMSDTQKRVLEKGATEKGT